MEEPRDQELTVKQRQAREAAIRQRRLVDYWRFYQSPYGDPSFWSMRPLEYREGAQKAVHCIELHDPYSYFEFEPYELPTWARETQDHEFEQGLEEDIIEAVAERWEAITTAQHEKGVDENVGWAA